ncbi:class I adenylate-forming enzyme family protein [Chthonobacter rhizosphaerae]|uniref:class I adenylate-forming enzyme family protein n=1 Tax=Chthonobacter rhizosphaerae TaxID=2735553 RepID=UPI0015EE9F25|nr:class I adenylate-forming enzyme family protein [Chthonobacter rhizosphaerae]
MLMHRLLEASALRVPDRVAFRWVDRDRTLTYAEAVAAMERMAGALAHLGVAPGDRVLIFAHNGLDVLTAMLGAWRIGAIAALVNVRYADELAYYVGDHRPKVIVYTHDMGAPVREAAQSVGGVAHLVCMDGPQEGAVALGDLMAAAFAPPADPGRADAIAHLSYTSGTTGRPKGACLAHEPTVTAARCIGERLRIRGDDRSFGPTALSSSYQLVANLLPQMAVSATINVMGRWTAATGYDALAATQATIFVGNPVVLTDLLEESEARGRLPSLLRFGLSGGGPVPPALKIAFRDRLALPLVESYGQSELGGFFALGFPELEPDDGKLLRVGPGLPDKEVAILTSSGEVADLGRIGEISLRGGFMAGYWGRTEQTEAATRGGWLRSGDLGVMDAEGYVTMRGRRSELVTVDGVDWYPRDVEEALAAEPGVSLAALVGVTVAGRTRPVAFVTAKPGTPPELAGLKAAIAPRLPYDLAPLEIRLAPSLPTTPTGKIARATLAETAFAEAAA